MKAIKSIKFFAGRITLYLFLFYFTSGSPCLFGQSEKEDNLAQPQEGAEYKAEALRDPFRSYFEAIPVVVPQPVETGPVAEAPQLKIQGIFWGGNFPQAIVNDKVVKEGDTIEGVKVIKIDKGGLQLSFANREYSLSAPAAK